MKIVLVIALGALLLPWVVSAASGDSQAPGDLPNLDLEQLLQIKVAAASLHEQSLEDAPASVTIITQEEIRKYGWRTLGEALSYARGLYITTNRTFHNLGVRGFSLPSDSGTRILVMINGHNLADTVLDQAPSLDQDFPLDMTLVKRIEIIRGPSSALYGSNGLFATINVVTFSPREFDGTKVRIETGSFGEKKLQASSSMSLGKGASILFSGSLFNDSGEHAIYVREYDSPATNYGRAIDSNGDKGYHLFSSLTWRGWSLTALFGERVILQPISWGPVLFNDRGTRLGTARNFIEAAYTHDWNESRGFEWRISYDGSRTAAIFHYPPQGIVDNRTRFTGDSVDTQLTYRFPVPHFGSLTVGAAGQFGVRAEQHVYDVKPVSRDLFRIDKPDAGLAVFAQDELNLTPRWKLDLGVRLDRSQYRRSFVSPRTALIFQPSSKASYKLLYGRAFRNPSAFELFFDTGVTQIANPRLQPEEANTFEFVAERKLNRRLNLLATAYRYQLSNLLVGEYTGGPLQYHNAGRVHASGLEMEMNGHPLRWLEVVTSLVVERAVNGTNRYPLANSPGQIGKLRLSVPLLSKRLSLAGGTQYMGSRQTLAGATLPSVLISDVTLCSTRLTRNLDFQAGMRDLSGLKRSDPIALFGRFDTIPVPGRSLFVALNWWSER